MVGLVYTWSITMKITTTNQAMCFTAIPCVTRSLAYHYPFQSEGFAKSWTTLSSFVPIYSPGQLVSRCIMLGIPNTKFHPSLHSITISYDVCILQPIPPEFPIFLYFLSNQPPKLHLFIYILKENKKKPSCLS